MATSSTLNQPGAALVAPAASSNHISVYLNEFGLPTNLTEIVLANENNNTDPFKIMNNFCPAHNTFNVNGNQIAGIIIQPSQELNNKNIYIVHNQPNHDQQIGTGTIRISQSFENNPASIEIHPSNINYNSNNAFDLAGMNLLQENNNIIIDSCVSTETAEKQIRSSENTIIIEQGNEIIEIQLDNADPLVANQTDKFSTEKKTEKVSDVVKKI